MNIEVDPDAAHWGANARDIRAVLASAAQALIPHARAQLPSIFVYPRFDLPQADWDLDPEGNARVGLTARGNHWAQFAYQFGHELCHVIALHHQDGRSRIPAAEDANRWFEECLCEAASLFVLRKMGKSWADSPPFPSWASFGVELTGYAAARLSANAHQLPSGESFSSWFQHQHPSLRSNGVQREKNNIIAAQLVALLEASPSGWATVPALRPGQVPGRPFERFLATWRSNCDPEGQRFVEQLGSIFSVS